MEWHIYFFSAARAGGGFQFVENAMGMLLDDVHIHLIWIFTKQGALPEHIQHLIAGVGACKLLLKPINFLVQICNRGQRGTVQCFEFRDGLAWVSVENRWQAIPVPTIGSNSNVTVLINFSRLKNFRSGYDPYLRPNWMLSIKFFYLLSFQ